MRWPFAKGPEPTPQPPLEPIRIYTDDAVFAGSVSTEGQRLTDILQHNDELSFLPEGADRNSEAAWVLLPTVKTLFIVPPPHESPPEQKQPRDRQEVTLNIGAYRITGTAHLRPGLERDVYLRATQPYLPLTDATVMPADGSSATALDVVIVNLRWAEFVET